MWMPAERNRSACCAATSRRVACSSPSLVKTMPWAKGPNFAYGLRPQARLVHGSGDEVGLEARVAQALLGSAPEPGS